LDLGTKFSSDVTSLLAGVSQVRTALKQFSTMSKKAATQSAQLQSTVVGTAAASTRASAATKRLGTAHQVLGKQIGSVVGGLERIKAAMRVTLSYGVAATLIFGFTRALKAGVDEIVEFDQGLKNLQAITGATNSEILAMSDTMLQLASDTKFSAAEIASGMVLLGQAGFSASESLNAIEATSTLATGTLQDM
ncbi:unnamed protein product, partial [marine sediment metagenome]